MQACVSNHVLGKVWDDISYPFTIYNGVARNSNSHAHLLMYIVLVLVNGQYEV